MIIVGLFLLLLRALVAYYQARQSLQWWYQRQSLKLRHEAEEIRNGLLQESFALRRSLELSLINQNESLESACLETMQGFHTSLKDLSDRLSPPFIDESLPHAIQYAIDAWQTHYPAVMMTATLPEDWQPDGYEQRRAILMVMDELLHLRLSELPAIEAITVHLQHQRQKGELTIQFSYSSSSSPNVYQASSSFDHLKRVFRFLTSGNCSYRCTPSAMTWNFHWQLPGI